MLNLHNNRGSAMFMALVIIMLLMTISVAVIAIQASDNRIIDLYGQRGSNILGALNLSRSLPDGMVDQPYEGHITATGGDGTYAFSIVLGTLPDGLTWSNGDITGTPTTAGTYPFKVRVTDGKGRQREREYRITITGEPLEPLVLGELIPDAGFVGQPYTGQIAATGGDGNYTFSIVEGALPGGLAMDGSIGDITGTPTTVGTYTFTIRVTDGTGNYCERQYQISITKSLTLHQLIPNIGWVGQPYTGPLSVTGGDGDYAFSLVVGALPAGLTLNSSTGLISGTPTAAGTYYFTIRVVDGSGGVGQRDYQLIIKTFADYVLTDNLYVFGNEVKIDGSSTISGEEATEEATGRSEMVLNQDSSSLSQPKTYTLKAM